MTDKQKRQEKKSTFTHMITEWHAEAYGVNAALILNKLVYYVRKNIGIAEHTFEGRTYDRFPMKSWGRILPFLTPDQIRHALGKLIDAGVVLSTQKLNKNWSEQALWYGFADEELFLNDCQPVDVSQLGKIPTVI